MTEPASLPPGFDLLAAFQTAVIQRRDAEVAAESDLLKARKAADDVAVQVQKIAEAELSALAANNAVIRRNVERAGLAYPTSASAPADLKPVAGGDPERELMAAAARTKSDAAQAAQALGAIRRARHLRRFAVIFAVLVTMIGIALLIQNGPALWSEWTYRRATADLAAPNYEAARVKLQRLLSVDPTYKDAQTLLRESYYLPAESAIQAATWEEAAQALVHLQQLEPDYRGISAWLIQYPQLRGALARLYAALWSHAMPFTVKAFENEEEGAPVSLAFSPRGDYLAAGWPSGSVSLWQTATGREVQHLAGQTTAVTAVVFALDGEMLAVAGVDGVVRQWHALIGEAARSYDAHSGPVRDVAYSPDGKTLASAGADGVVRLWSAASPDPPKILVGHRGEIRSVAFAQEGKLLASVGADRTLRLWDLSTGKAVRIISELSSQPVEVAFDPAGELVWAVGDDGQITLWHIASGERRLSFGGADGALVAAAFGPSREVVVLSTQAGSTKLWETAAGRVAESLASVPVANCVAFSWDGRLLALGGLNGAVTVWSVEPESNEPILLPTPTPGSSVIPTPTVTSSPRPSATVSPVPAQAGPIAEVIPKGVNVRKGPGTSFPIVAGAFKGEKLIVLGRNQDCTWWLVRTPKDKIGWVSQDLLKSELGKCDPPLSESGATAPDAVAALPATALPAHIATLAPTVVPVPAATRAAPTPTSAPIKRPTPPPTKRPVPTPAPTQPPPNRIASTTDQFSGSQGDSGWSYMWEGYGKRGSFDWKPLPNFDGSCWRGDQQEHDIRICAGGEVHPGWGSRIAYQWKSKVSGKILTKVHLHKLDTCGDGIELTTYRFADRVRDPLAVGGNDTRGRDDSFALDVWQGDLLYFVLDIRGEPTCDKSQVRVEIDQSS